MLPYIARTALFRTSLSITHFLKPSVRFVHTQRRTLPEFSLEGKVAVGKCMHGSLDQSMSDY
jgi:hypothetical protein